jgi:hypothetical protein
MKCVAASDSRAVVWGYYTHAIRMTHPYHQHENHAARKERRYVAPIFMTRRERARGALPL